jgi:hypothetical protein
MDPTGMENLWGFSLSEEKRVAADWDCVGLSRFRFIMFIVDLTREFVG